MGRMETAWTSEPKTVEPKKHHSSFRDYLCEIPPVYAKATPRQA
jgi:hypothetical protein